MMRFAHLRPQQAPQPSRASAWCAELGFRRTPAFAFFDTQGNSVMLSDATMLRQRLVNTPHYVLEKADLEPCKRRRRAAGLHRGSLLLAPCQRPKEADVSASAGLPLITPGSARLRFVIKRPIRLVYGGSDWRSPGRVVRA
jgi:hypothetical protein